MRPARPAPRPPAAPARRPGAGLAALALLVGTAVLVPAGAARAAAVAVEAEAFALPTAAGQVYPDGAASAGAGLLIWTNATAAATVTTPATGAVSVRVRGDQCQGAPQLQLTVDGVPAGRVPVPETAWTTKVFPGSWAAGSHRLGLSYLNDIDGAGCDRNLRVDLAQLLTTAPVPAAVQAERLRVAPTVGGAYADPTAAGGAGLVLRRAGAVSAVLAAPPGGELVVRARGDSCDGPPRMIVTVDAEPALDVAVPAADWSRVPVPDRWRGGQHRVTVAFPEDHVAAGCDRNLRLDLLAVRPAPTPVRTFGLSSAGPGQGITTAQATGASLGRPLDVVNFYSAWEWGTPLPVADLQAIAAGGARPEITWEPWDPRLGTTQPGYSLAGIAGGAHDAYLTSWARDAAAYGGPILLRFAHEMNGGWYPWSASANGGSPTDYLAAYRHVHDVFLAQGARNVSWVWSPNVVQGMPTPLAEVYPGPAYVDVIGVDGYNGGSDVASMGGWRTPQQVFEPSLLALRALAPGVPVILNETGSSENGGDKAAWIGELFGYLATTAVTGVVWFDHATEGQADWRLATSPTSFSAARTALATW